MAHLSTGQRLKLTWWQRSDALYLSFAIPGADGEQPTQKQTTDGTIILEWSPVTFEANFFKPVIGISARWKVVGRGKIEVELRKGDGHDGAWRQPFDVSFPFCFKNWDKIDDEDMPDPAAARPDDRTLPQMMDGMRVVDSDELAQDVALRFFEAPPLYLGGDEADVDVSTDAAGDAVPAADVTDPGTLARAYYPWLNAWASFKIEQRMVTMAEFWNEMSSPPRITAARRLVDILQAGDASLNQLDAAIKGGNFARIKLDTSVYDSVARPAHWLESFTHFEADEQVRVMELCFTALNFDEKKVVVATFM